MTIRCATCGGSLPAPSSTGRPRTFCTTSCRREREATLCRIRARIGDLENERSLFEREVADGEIETLTARGRVTLPAALASVAAALSREFARIAALTDEP